MAEKQEKLVEVKVNANTVVGSNFAQVGVVTAAGEVTTIEFVFVHPQKQDEGQVVTRVTMPTDQAKRLGEVLQSTIEKNEKRTK